MPTILKPSRGTRPKAKADLLRSTVLSALRDKYWAACATSSAASSAGCSSPPCWCPGLLSSACRRIPAVGTRHRYIPVQAPPGSTRGQTQTGSRRQQLPAAARIGRSRPPSDHGFKSPGAPTRPGVRALKDGGAVWAGLMSARSWTNGEAFRVRTRPRSSFPSIAGIPRSERVQIRFELEDRGGVGPRTDAARDICWRSCARPSLALVRCNGMIDNPHTRSTGREKGSPWASTSDGSPDVLDRGAHALNNFPHRRPDQEGLCPGSTPVPDESGGLRYCTGENGREHGAVHVVRERLRIYGSAKVERYNGVRRRDPGPAARS